LAGGTGVTGHDLIGGLHSAVEGTGGGSVRPRDRDGRS
jgi:hypothetical protein